MSRTLLHDWECSIEKNKNNTEELLKIAEDIYNTAYARGKASEERPHGEWINREAISNTIFPFWERYECNQCHKFNGYSNFCPNCGCDMRNPNCVTCDHFGKCEGCEKGEEE